MAEAITIKTKGFNELDKELARLPLKLQRRVMSRAVRQAARVVQKDAKARAPKRTKGWEGMEYPNAPGNLKKNIKIERKKRGPKDEITDIVTHGKGAWYGRLVELGHRIVKTSKTEFYTGNQGRRRRGRFTGKWVAGKPHLRPALDANVAQVIRTMRLVMAQGIKKYKRG
jgi:HK97 gp10 family phage protein